MKQVLTLLLFVLGTSAFAATGDEHTPPPSVETHETKECKKANARQNVKSQEAQREPVQREKPKREGTTKTCTTAEKAPLGLSGYVVDFVHSSNMKLVKLLLD